MEDLPEDVMVDILSRLPVKTIIHCKSVCKKWRNLVFDYFVNLHLARSPKCIIIHHNPHINMIDYSNRSDNPGILKWMEIQDKVDYHRLYHDPLMSLDLNLAPILQKPRIKIMGSVSGLICLWQFGSNVDNTCICNPITREYMILPNHQHVGKYDDIIVYGFGVGSRTGEYKVVRVFQGDIPTDPYLSARPRVSEAEVYTLGTGQWRSVGHVPYWLDDSDQPFLNGHIHWYVNEEDSTEKLCAFDLDKETFQLFPSPPADVIEKGLGHFYSLAVLKGCLCQADTYDSQFSIWIWVMKEYGIKKSWHKEVVIQQSICPDLGWPIWEPMYLMEFLEDGSILMVSCTYKLLVYCPQSKTGEVIEMFDGHVSGLVYHPSFIELGNFESEIVHMF